METIAYGTVTDGIVSDGTIPDGANPKPHDWLTADQAAKLSGQSVRTWRWRAWREASNALREGRQSLARKAAPRCGRGKEVWYVHHSLDEALSPYTIHRLDMRPPLSTRYPQHVVARAMHRNRWLQRWRSLCGEPRDAGETDRVLAERVLAEARSVEGEDFKISVRSLYHWWREYNRTADDGQILGVDALVDRYYASRLTSNNANRSPEAAAYFYDLFHTQNRLSVKMCHEATLRSAAHEGWSWPASYGATLGWLRQHDDRSLTSLMREGRDVWARRYLPHLQVDYTRLEPGEMYVADHHRCDFWVSYKERQIRPWLTAVQDGRSRCIVGWHLGPAAHQDAILCALRRALSGWAIPRVMRIDNGRDFTSKPITGVTKRERDRLRGALGSEWRQALNRADAFTDCDDPRWLGVTGELGIELIYATPYAPWSKGILERWFGTFTDQHAKTYATYCGNSALSKPECLEEIRRGYTDAEKRRLRQEYGRAWKRHVVLHLVDQRDVPTLEGARRRVGEYLDVYHRTNHRGLCGATPLAVWNTAVHLRRAQEDALLCLMDVRGLYRVSANGVTLRVGPASLCYGARCQALKRWVGRQVLIALDPENVSCCWALTPDRTRRELIARLDPNEFVEPYSCADDVREAIAEKKREQTVMHKAARTAAGRTKRACQRINEHGRARRGELLATGTGDGEPRIEPVRTGFEGLSKRVRNGSKVRLPGSRGLAELWVDEATADGSDDDGLEDLLDAEPLDPTPDPELEDLL